MQANIGTEIKIKLFKPIDNKKEYKGILKSFDKDYITIENEQEIKIARKNISQIKTVYNW